MDNDELKSFLEAVLTRELKTIEYRFGALDKALNLQHEEYLRRLEALNGEIERRAQQEKSDREEFVQSAEFKEVRGENQTWRTQIEKELRAFPTIQDVQQWVAVLQAKVDSLEAAARLTGEALITAKAVTTTKEGEDERARQIRQAAQYKIVLIASFLSSILTGGILLLVSRWLAGGK